MLHILICDDNPQHRARMEHIVTKHIEKAPDAEMKLVLSASTPTEILDYLQKHPNGHALYFLDVDLQDDKIDGIELGAKIRETDHLAKIVFITTHDDLAYLTFKYKIEALDFIVKDGAQDIPQRAAECIKEAYARYQKELSEQTRYLRIEAHGEIWNIPYDDILFFETHPQISERMILHMENDDIDFRGIISKMVPLVPDFYRCHKSFIVNPKKVARVDKNTKEAVMADESRIPVATKKVSELLRLIE